MAEHDILPDGRHDTSTLYLLARYRTVSRQMGFRAANLATHGRWKGAQRARLRQITGIETMLPWASNPQVRERVSLNGARSLENVAEQLAMTQRAYGLLDAPDRLAHSVFEGEHRWHGVEAIP